MWALHSAHAKNLSTYFCSYSMWLTNEKKGRVALTIECQLYILHP